MSAFTPTANNDGGHQNQISSSGFNYQLPYFGPVFGQYLTNGYQLGPAGGIPNAFPTMNHNPVPPMNPMNNLHPQHQIPQISSDPNAFRLFQNNQLSLYNMKNEYPESTSVSSAQNNPSINDSKSSSTNDSLGSGESSPLDENRTPARVIKPTAKVPKQGFKSPEEESAYRVRRQKNNEAARQSRIRRQQRERQLQDENDILKQELEVWKNKYADLARQIKPNAQVLGEIHNQKR